MVDLILKIGKQWFLYRKSRGGTDYKKISQ